MTPDQIDAELARIIADPPEVHSFSGVCCRVMRYGEWESIEDSIARVRFALRENADDE